MSVMGKKTAALILIAALSGLLWLLGLGISLGGEVKPSNLWINLYSENTTADGQPAAAGAVVAVFDPDGVQCGEYSIVQAGLYGVMPCYGDDPDTSDVDEGAEPGDVLSFTIDGRPSPWPAA